MTAINNNKYKFAFIVSLFFEYGGMQRTLFRVAEECSRRGHEVHVLTGGWIGEKSDNIEVHEFDTRAPTNVWSNDILLKKVRQHIAGNDYDCIVGFTKIPGLDVYYAGDPCYAARVDEGKGWFYKLLPRYRGFKRQEAAVFAPGTDTEILLIAHQEKEKFIHYYGTEADRFHLLPPGINRDRLLAQQISNDDKQTLRSGLGIAEDDNMILLVGSRFRTKGVDRAIRALASLPEAGRAKSKLVVVGGDKQGPYLKLARQYGVADRVLFIGERDDVAVFYASADLLLHPPYSENTGTILIEAMLFGLPVLVTGNCGFEYHVRDAGAGMICPYPFQQYALNRMLSEMLVSDKRPQWRTGGRIYCEKTDLYSLIERAVDVIIDRADRNVAITGGVA
ncbi:MAG: glycosyltransferase family 4 protein [Gammaproteobacteria bacterium]|nr:MAG: glycosyltransferase family 4 protein [Gammaproteobacteria bacterium]